MVEQSFIWLGKHEGQTLLPAIPLAHSRLPDPDGRRLLLMSDGSVHKVTQENLDKALAAASSGAEPPYHSTEPQTLEDAGKALVPMCK